MSLPKEPRQKMINMMYLVLTAMLALNVSAEILNAFKTVNNSITSSNSVIAEKNDLTYKSFEEKLKDPQTAVNAQIWAPKANEAKKLSASIYSQIEEMKGKLIAASGPYEEDGKKRFREDDLDAPTRLLLEEGEGKKLYADLQQYKQQMLNILKPEEFASSPLLQADVKGQKDAFTKQFPLDMKIPESQTGNNKTGDDALDWTTNYFHMTPSIAAMTILSKFQNDIKNSESQMVDYCHKKIGEVKVVYDKFEAFAGTNATYLMPGDEFDITAGIGSFSASAKPDITINGAHQNLNADGVAEYKTKVESAGEKTVEVKIEYVKPDGSKDHVTKLIKYTVGLPSGASVFLEKMNVVYIGVDNPITISGGSVGREKVKVSFTSPGANLTNTSGDHWIIKPTTQGLAKLIVNAAGKPYEFPLRVKNLPLPAGFVGAKKGGGISAAEFKAIGGLIARLEDSDFEAPFKVVSYTMGAIGGSINQYAQANNDGNRWNGPAGQLVQKATPGTNIFFDNIKVVGPDGKPRDIAPMVFSLK